MYRPPTPCQMRSRGGLPLDFFGYGITFAWHAKIVDLSVWMTTLKHCLPLALMGLLAVGCNSTLAPYPSQVRPTIQQLAAGRPVDHDRLFAGKVDGQDRILYLLERGRVAQLQGNLQVSLNSYAAAQDAIRRQDEEAVLTAGDVAAQAAAVLLNDNAIPYRPDGYERVMLHHFQAQNFLVSGNLEATGVEVRRGNFEQRQALQRHEQDIQRAQQRAADRQVDSSQAMNSLSRAYAGMDEVAGKVKNSFQNAYTFYLSGVVYELMGEPNHAYIDYKQALEIMPENRHLQRDVVRLAESLAMHDDLDAFRRRFADLTVAAANPEQGTLVVLYEDGFVPAKEQIKLPIPLFSANSFTTIAFPFYGGGYQAAVPLVLSVDGRELGRTELVCHLQALAVRALKEKMVGMVIRQVLRATSRGVAAKMASDQGEEVGALFIGLIGFLMENADRRSWLTLPSNAQVGRFALDAGPRRLELAAGGGPSACQLDVEIQPGKVTVLVVARSGTTYHSVQATY